MHEITKLLRRWADGDEQAFVELIPLVDKELKKTARKYLRNERRDHILQPTALVNEALIKLIPENISWESRKQFYGFVRKRMRQVLIDYAKKNPHVETVDIDDIDLPDEKSKEILRLEDALIELAGIDERIATVVECRFFIGLKLAEIARILGVGESTVERDWRFARDWLKSQMLQG